MPARRPDPLQAAPARRRDSRRRLLVVDDEESVRAILRDLLEALGHEVELAHDGFDGVRCFREDPAGFDLVVLDMAMPRMDGRACFRELKRIDPALRVLLVTGHAFDGGVQSLLDEGLRGVLQKPFAVQALSDAVDAALNGAPA